MKFGVKLGYIMGIFCTKTPMFTKEKRVSWCYWKTQKSYIKW